MLYQICARGTERVVCSMVGRRCRSFCLLVTFVASVLLASCTYRPPASAGEVLVAMEGAAGMSGILRTRSASPDSPLYLTDVLLAAVYGEAARGWLTDNDGGVPLVNDAALSLPAARHPCELAVFRCSDARAVATAARGCRSRLEAIRRVWQGSEWDGVLESAIVTVEGDCVLLIVAPQPDVILAAARRAIRSGAYGGEMHESA